MTAAKVDEVVNDEEAKIILLIASWSAPAFALYVVTSTSAASRRRASRGP
jgi:hypothetical protein